MATMALSAVSLASSRYKTFVQEHSGLVFVSVFGALGFMLLTYWKRKEYPTNLIFLTCFTALEAYAVSVITSFYEQQIVLEALVFTVGIFIALTLFACQTKYDFTSWIPYLFGALWVLILFGTCVVSPFQIPHANQLPGFMASFLPGNSKVELGYGVAAALIFSAYILVDTQLVMRHYHVEEEIAASISLYLDVLNLFLAILRILNNQQSN